MKILLSAYQIDPTRGSEWGISWTWLLEHARLGHEVTCLTSVWGRGNREHLETQLAEADLPNVRFEFVDLPGWFRGWGHPDSTLGVHSRYLLWQRAAARVAKRLDAEHDFDLVHHVSWGNVHVGSSLWRLKKPLLFGPVGGGQTAPKAFRKYFESGWRQEQLRSAIGWAMTTFLPDHRNVLNRADRVVVVNPETAELAARGRARVELFTEMSIDPNRIPSGMPERDESEELRLLWVGRLLPRKGLPLVLDALSRLNDTPYRLTIIGHGELADRLPGWLKEYGVEDRVDFRGKQSFEEVTQAYSDHDAFLFTSLRDSNAVQFVEAMTYGLPVITLNLHGGAVIVPDDAGIKVPATTPEETATAVANAVRQLANNPALRRSMGEAGFHHVREELIPAKQRFLANYLSKFELATSVEPTPV